MDLLCFCSVLCLLCLCARLFIFALWSPAGKGLTSWLSFVVSAVVCHFPIGILGQVWYLIVSIPDLCTLTYFAKAETFIQERIKLEQEKIWATMQNIQLQIWSAFSSLKMHM